MSKTMGKLQLGDTQVNPVCCCIQEARLSYPQRLSLKVPRSPRKKDFESDLPLWPILSGNAKILFQMEGKGRAR